jgi:hypothetical protein
MEKFNGSVADCVAERETPSNPSPAEPEARRALEPAARAAGTAAF